MKQKTIAALVGTAIGSLITWIVSVSTNRVQKQIANSDTQMQRGIATDCNEDGSKWFPMKGAFEHAAKATTSRNKQQHPKYEPGRRLNLFPFRV